MNFLHIARRKRIEAEVDSLARDIARRVQPDVWDRVRDEILMMNIAEARGYARARAAAIVRGEVRSTLVAHETLEQWARQLLADLAMERTVHRLITNLVSGGPTARRAVAVPAHVDQRERRAA